VQTFTTTLPLIREGKLLPLAVGASKRVAAMPEVPTMLEAGLSADAIYPFYSGLFVPAKTPRAVAEKLRQEAAKALQTPAVQARLATLGVEPMPMTLDEFDKFFREDVAAAVALAKAAKIQTQ
jgi:tripartite-type tricarboxylate transporter receptor subunit TctC